MLSSLEDAKQLLIAIKNGTVQPIYFLMGEEPYFIDMISSYIEGNILKEEEKGFNQVVLYGRDVSVEDIVGHAKRFPMMAERQVVIVKEAQELSRTIEKLESYAKHPQPTTVLVVCYKYKKLDKRKALYKAIKKNGTILESKPLYENQIPDFIKRSLMSKGYTIEPKASQMLVEFLGTSLSKIINELNKLQIILPSGTQITADHIEENIGISKDYNNFELRKAIGCRNDTKAFKIIAYFGENPKDNPMVVTVSLLFNFFSQLLHYHGLNNHSPGNVASSLKINPYFVKDYTEAARHFPMKKVSQNIALLREFDVKGKGVNANAIPQRDLLKELLVRLLA